jgi:acetyltransferase
MSHIQVMFDPKTIALIGATEKRGAVGRTILENLLRSKERKIFPVNPLRQMVLDVKSYPSISGVPEHVNLAVVETPARSVPVVGEECGQAGVEGATCSRSRRGGKHSRKDRLSGRYQGRLA